MTQPQIQSIPSGHEGLIPHLVCDPCSDAIEFYKKAFGADEVCRVPAPDGKRLIHAQILIDNRPVYLADDFPEYCNGKACSPKALGASPVTIHRYAKDCDAAIERAKNAGATVTMPPENMFWGDRYGLITDPFGHTWSFATHISDPTPEEIAEAAKNMFAQA